MDIIWYDDYSILYKNDNYLDFIPSSKMSYNEKINAIVRFCIYSIILSFIFNKSQRILILPILIIFITKVFDIRDKKMEKYINDDNNNINNNYNNDNNDNNDNDNNDNNDNDDNDDTNNKVDNNKMKMVYDTIMKKNDISFESGILNKDGKYDGGEIYRDPTYPKLDDVEKMGILEERRPLITRQPTVDNPYMNPFVTDFNNEDITPAPCNVDDMEIHNKISKKFNNGLFMNIDDLWDIKNSQRQFFTLPVNSIAGNQKDFAEWLYKDKECCKTDQMGCLKYEDLRYKRF